MVQVMALYRPWVTPSLVSKLRHAYGTQFYDLTEIESPEQFRTCLRSAAIAGKAILTINTGLVRRALKAEGFEFMLVYPFMNTDFEKIPPASSYMLRQVYESRNEAGAYHQEIRNQRNMVMEYDIKAGWIVEEIT